MIIKFRPQKSEIQTTATIENNILKYNEKEVDLSTIPMGATAKNEYLTIDKNLNGAITILMLWQYQKGTIENCFPKDLKIEDGEIFPKESTK